MGIIQKLDAQLSNMIAAGEVVERPAGIIKELIDNSIDAKSTKIAIHIKQGGLSAIEVIDNGIGMDARDATMAFMRHATSKIKQENDLWSIKTLGFRGEALPSIAAVSKVELSTSDGKESTKVSYAFGQLVQAAPYPANQGTRIVVEELFYKTPARLKYLKTPQYEASIIQDVVVKFALGYPNIAFHYVADDKVVLNTLGTGEIKDVFFQVYGKQMASESVELKAEDYDYKISGLACLPSISRANRNYMHIYINHRMIRYYKLQMALAEAFHEFMPKDRFPVLAINIEMDEKLVDVNVHPSKWEVRLSKENQLIQLVKQMVEKALSKNNEAPSIILKTQVSTPIIETVSLFENTNEDSQSISPAQSTYEAKPSYAPIYIQEEKIDNFQVEPIQSEEKDLKPTQSIKEETQINTFPTLYCIGQYDLKYVLAGNEEALYIIDQHAAEERVNFEYYRQLFDDQSVQLQSLLMPISIVVNGKVLQNIESINQELADLGIHFEVFGTQDVLIREVPRWMVGMKAASFLQDLLDYYENHERFNLNELTKDKLATMACHHSVRFNHPLSMDEMKDLLHRLSQAKNPYNCPHGRPTFMKLSQRELERNFKR